MKTLCSIMLCLLLAGCVTPIPAPAPTDPQAAESQGWPVDPWTEQGEMTTTNMHRNVRSQ